MSDPVFFHRAVTPTIAEIAAWTGATIAGEVDATGLITGVAPLDQATPADLAFLENPKYADMLSATRAGACLVQARYASRVPSRTVALVCAAPYRALADVLSRLYPSARRPAAVLGGTGVMPGAIVHPTARLEPGVHVDPGAVIGPRVEVGHGTVIAASAVIAADVRIGRECSIGAGAVISHALIGDRVILHPGVRIGQDGFGFAMGPQGHVKVAQIGRVIVQNDVEIGANSCIDRGANRDTVIGEGTKIDNLVQIGHNVTIGRHCVIVSHVGISGSTEIGDFVAIGGQAGIAGHLRIGPGAQIAAQSGVMSDIPARAKWGGSPAQPMRDWFRGVARLRKLARDVAGGDEAGSQDADRG